MDSAKGKMINKRRGGSFKEGHIPWNKGKKGVQPSSRKGKTGFCSQETLIALSKSLMGNQNGKGFKHSKEFGENVSRALIGRKLSEEHKENIAKGNRGKVASKEKRLKISLSLMGEKHHNWKGGISNELYCDIWLDKEYKEDILSRDNHVCQSFDCWKTIDRLCCHHINYDKKNCHPWNIITLCISCNSRANTNRKHWTGFYQEIMTEKYEYKYE